MDTATYERIVGEVRQIHAALWRQRKALWREPPRDGFDLLPIPVENVACVLLRLSLSEPEEIPSERPGFQVAGLLNRTERRIVLAQKPPLEWRRFTLAHEIGHYILHPQLVLHRDRSLNGGERSNGATRPAIEQEADLFAARLLMPQRLLVEAFRGRFGPLLDVRQ